MEYNKLIAEMSLSDEVEGFYVLKAAYPKTTATGKPFLSASLSDRSGSIEIKVWDYSGPISSADEGNVVKIRGTVSEFRGTPQITVDRIRLADDNDTYDLSALVPVAPIDVDTTMAEVERLISSIMEPEDLAVIGHTGDLLVDIYARNLTHIYILPQCSTTAARVLNPAGMDAQFERLRCAISCGILRV